MKLIPTLCAICGIDNSTQLYPANFSAKDLTRETFSARRIPDRVHYRIVCCKNCGLVYSNPILDSKTIAKLYQSSYVNYEAQMEDLSKTYWRYFLTMTSTETKVTAKVLEIGCGNGFFLDYLRKKGLTEVWGVEPSKSATLKAPTALKRRIVNSILRPNLFPKNSFDFICTFQTLDHVTNPNQFLQICWQLIKPGGKMLAINHDISSWSAKLLGERSPIIDIEHIYLFNKETLRRIFAKNGFTVENVFTTIDQHRLAYWVKMLPLPKSLKDLILAMLRITKLTNILFKIPAGNIGIVGKKK